MSRIFLILIVIVIFIFGVVMFINNSKHDNINTVENNYILDTDKRSETWNEFCLENPLKCKG